MLKDVNIKVVRQVLGLLEVFKMLANEDAQKILDFIIGRVKFVETLCEMREKNVELFDLKQEAEDNVEDILIEFYSEALDASNIEHLKILGQAIEDCIVKRNMYFDAVDNDCE